MAVRIANLVKLLGFRRLDSEGGRGRYSWGGSLSPDCAPSIHLADLLGFTNGSVGTNHPIIEELV